MQGKEKKRHHYVPKAYLRAFCDEGGKLWAFAKDEPLRPFRVSPDGIAHERYYYSQPLPEGGQDNDQLEDLFNVIESEWPPIVARWQAGDPVNDKLDVLFQFIATMRVRVPAARDVAEAWLANSVKETARHLESRGKLPPMPTELSRGWDDIVVSIDPHKSLHAMASLIQGLSKIFNEIGLEVVRNDTDIPLLTSDNPVAYFDPDSAETALLPYTVRPGRRPIELLISVTPKLMLRGHSGLKRSFSASGISFRRIVDRQQIKRFNRIISRFGYRFVFASDRNNAPVILKYASSSPVPDFLSIKMSNGQMVLSQMIFGERRPKPKWNPRLED